MLKAGESPWKNGPAATIGTGPGHEGLGSSAVTPAPGDYKTEEQRHIPGGSYFGTCRRSCEGPAHERRRFRQVDSNHDGILDFDEVCELLRRGDTSVQVLEVKKLFDAMDTSKDGKIQYEELVAFLDSASVKGSVWRRKLRDAFSMSQPGPCDYAANDQARSRHKQQPKAVIGQGPGHESLCSREITPGPSTYQVNHKAVTTHSQRVRIGAGPAHEALHKADAGPGPADYDVMKSRTSRHRSTTKCTIGQQAGHEDVFASTSTSAWTPGPASYTTDYRHQSNQRKQPAATFGRSGWRSATSATPGPASYNTSRRERIPGGACFGGAPDRFKLPHLSPAL